MTMEPSITDTDEENDESYLTNREMADEIGHNGILIDEALLSDSIVRAFYNNDINYNRRMVGATREEIREEIEDTVEELTYQILEEKVEKYE